MSSNSNLMIPRASSSNLDNRISTSSLIDLDESMPEPSMPLEVPRPSTANSDRVSEVGSAFDLERHTSFMPFPSSNREPSIYISNDSDFQPRQTREPSLYMSNGTTFSTPTSNREPSIYVSDDSAYAASIQATRRPSSHSQPRGRNTSTADAFLDDANLYTSPEAYTHPPSLYSHARNGSANSGLTASPEYALGGRRSPSVPSVNSLVYQGADARALPPLPPLPEPPSERVMMGEGGPVMREEFLRLLEGMTSHLKFTGEFVAELPVRRSGRLSGTQNGQDAFK